ncbi:MAG: hypothetical protein Q8N08_08620 [Methanobacteriaceae archaeon]|nr:hypothetical protein [Methanobacteriaceae archaeon]
MKINPLAFDSLGVRSMATFVEIDQKIMIDPSTSWVQKGLATLPRKRNLMPCTRPERLSRNKPKKHI